MKKVAIGVALLFAALVVGCQDNNNNPISNNYSGDLPGASKKDGNPDGLISIKQNVTKEHGPEASEAYELSGTLQYTLTSAGEKNVYSLSIVFGGNMRSLADGKTTGRVDGESIEDVAIEPKGSVKVTKNYSVRGLEKRIRLFVTLGISPDNVELKNAWIEDDTKGGFSENK